MLPLTTTRVDVSRSQPRDEELYDNDSATPCSIESGVAAAIVAPTGSDENAGGTSELVDAVLLFPPVPVLAPTDQVHDQVTGERWNVTWVRSRNGLGLDHQRAGLRAVDGAA